MKVAITFVLLIFHATVSAQTNMYKDSLNLPAGKSVQIGNTVLYSDALNLPIGVKTQIGSTSIYSDALNLPLGAKVQAGPEPYLPPIGSKFYTIYDER
jgi:hypothetical protein